MSENETLRRRIAEELLGSALDDDGSAPCPGRELHNGRTGRRDFRVMLTGVPTGTCFHDSCATVVDEFNFQLRSRVGKAESGHGDSRGLGAPMGRVAREPVPSRAERRPSFDLAKLKDFARLCPGVISEEWLVRRSPVKFEGSSGVALSRLFLSCLYGPGERVLIFTREFSQGDFIWDAERGSFRLASRPGVSAVSSELPEGGPVGAWFLAQPVTGKWAPNPYNKDQHGAPKMGRRHGACVTSWRFLVVESDEAPAELWLRALVMLPLPIVAIYTSGGRSIHALVRVNAGSKSEWDAMRDRLVPVLCPIGADPAAMTAVRLTRLPGAMRHGTREADGRVRRYDSPRLQRLLWLNPGASLTPIFDLK